MKPIQKSVISMNKISPYDRDLKIWKEFSVLFWLSFCQDFFGYHFVMISLVIILGVN